MIINTNKIKYIKIKKRGFTLIEALISIFILTLAITGPTYIASLALRNTIESRDNISSQYLSEEVIEVIKNKITNNILKSNANGWLDGVYNIDASPCTIDNKCFMQKDSTLNDYEFLHCTGVCPKLSFNTNPDSSIIYGDSDISETSKFIREFYFEADTANDGEKVLVVNIKWKSRGEDKIYTLKERFYKMDYSQYFK